MKLPPRSNQRRPSQPRLNCLLRLPTPDSRLQTPLPTFPLQLTTLHQPQLQTPLPTFQRLLRLQTPDSRLKTPLTMVERPHALTGQRATATSTSTISLASCPSADATHPRSFDSTKSFKSW